MTGIACPKCGSLRHMVLDSRVREGRPGHETPAKRRRRICHACTFRFSTLEVSQETLHRLEDIETAVRKFTSDAPS